ncbi:MAG: efflux RND transporter permease subunit, partial [Gammaproteobacteria bacterium]
GYQGVSSVFAGAILKPWGQRHKNQNAIIPIMQQKLNTIPGLQVAAFPLPPLPVGGSNIPIQFTVNTTSGFPLLYEVSQSFFKAAKDSGMFVYINNTLKYNQPQLDVKINYSKAEELSINMQSVGDALAGAFGGNYINYFSMIGQSYKVISQVERRFRLTPDQIDQIYVKTASNQSVPLSTIADLVLSAQPNSLTHFQQIHSATIEAIPMPGVTLGEALHYLQKLADKTFPQGFTYNYAGQSRQFIQEGSALVVTLFFALTIIYLVLAAQFESFRDPFIILISVPMSICGALIPLNLGAATINIYTQVGLITLVGLISKHGILMVDFANHLQVNEGLSIREAIEKAASIRLRPILMTTAAMVIGVVPLIISSGAGAASRFDIGLVIATGMSIGTLFTLFVVPTMYTFIAKNKHKV